MRQTPRPDSDTFALGRAIHTAVLQPARLPLDYVCWVNGQRRGKKWEEYKGAADAAGLTILTADQLEYAIGCGVAVRGNKDAMALLEGGEVEIERVWVDEPTGLRIKGRVDCISGEGLIELKTSRNAADPRMFSRDVAKWHYHGQLALYRDGFEPGAQALPCHIIAVEPTPPHDVAVYSVMTTALDEGWRLCRRLLDQLAECLESDEWPGAVPMPTWLDIPEYAYGEAEDVGWMKEAG